MHFLSLFERKKFCTFTFVFARTPYCESALRLFLSRFTRSALSVVHIFLFPLDFSTDSVSDLFSRALFSVLTYGVASIFSRSVSDLVSRSSFWPSFERFCV